MNAAPNATAACGNVLGIHEGLDGWLFLRGGSNAVDKLYSRETGPLSDTRLADWRKLLEARVAKCRALGVVCVFAIVPEKLTIYGDMQGDAFVDPALSPAIRLKEQLAGSPAGDVCVDLVGPLREARKSAQVYWRQDSHWTPEGCHAAYLALCDHLDAAPERELLSRPHVEQARMMDLGGRMRPPRWERARLYDFAGKSKRVWINNVARYLEDPAYFEEFHVGARANFVNKTAGDPRSIVLFGDSCSRPDYRLLTGMLAETFHSVDYIWSSRVDWSYVRRRAPNIVIFEIAERFLAVLPRDTLRLPILEARVEARALWRQVQRWRAARA